MENYIRGLEEVKPDEVLSHVVVDGTDLLIVKDVTIGYYLYIDTTPYLWMSEPMSEDKLMEFGVSLASFMDKMVNL